MKHHRQLLIGVLVWKKKMCYIFFTKANGGIGVSRRSPQVVWKFRSPLLLRALYESFFQNKFTYVYMPRHKIEPWSNIEHYRKWSLYPYDLRSVIPSNYNMNRVSKAITLFISLAGEFYSTHIQSKYEHRLASRCNNSRSKLACLNR